MQPLKVYKFTVDLDTYLDLEVPTIVFWRDTLPLFEEKSGYKRELYEPDSLDLDKPFNIYLETNNPAFALEFATLMSQSPEEIENFDAQRLRRKFPEV